MSNSTHSTQALRVARVLDNTEYRVRDVSNFVALCTLQTGRFSKLRVRVHNLELVLKLFARKAVEEAELSDKIYKVVVRTFYNAKYFKVELTRIAKRSDDEVWQWAYGEPEPVGEFIVNAEFTFHSLQMLKEFLYAVFQRSSRGALFAHEIEQFF